ncbi:hypothetical protein AUN09_18535, partial [Cronobacter sakazakii]
CGVCVVCGERRGGGKMWGNGYKGTVPGGVLLGGCFGWGGGGGGGGGGARPPTPTKKKAENRGGGGESGPHPPLKQDTHPEEGMLPPGRVSAAHPPLKIHPPLKQNTRRVAGVISHRKALTSARPALP